MRGLLLPCCGRCLAKNQVAPDVPSSDQLSSRTFDDFEHTVHGVRRRRIVQPLAKSLPTLVRRLVLQEYAGRSPAPSVRFAVAFFLLGGCAFLILGEPTGLALPSAAA